MWRRVALVLLAGAALVGCGGDDDAGETRIGMLDNVFTRDVTRVPVGGGLAAYLLVLVVGALAGGIV